MTLAAVAGRAGAGPIGAGSDAGPGPLDLHKGISDPGGSGCLRWPENMRLQSTLGDLVPGRCKATNLCAYCAKLAAVENAELLWLDALNGSAPSVWVVLTTPSIDSRPKPFYRDREQLITALRRRFPGLAYAALFEMTTGYGSGSGGHRRPHWNLFLKGVGERDLPTIVDVVERIWCVRQGASIDAQKATYVRDVAGLIRYVALHFQKESQAPPPGWRGHRFLKSHDYLWLPTPAARAAAGESLRLKRALRRARLEGLEGAAAEEAAHLAVYEASELAWELVRLVAVPIEFADVEGGARPTAWETQAIPVR